MLELGGVVLKLKILTFYVGTWWCGLKLRIAVENLDVLCFGVVCVCVRACVRMCASICTHVRACVRVCDHMRMCTRECACVCVYACGRVCTRARVAVCSFNLAECF